MKPRRENLIGIGILLSGLAGVGLQAGIFTADFNDAKVPVGSSVQGNAVVEAAGGVDNSGVLKITKNINSLQGAFIIEDLDGGASLYGFRATFKALIGRGTSIPADGWSFNLAPDIPDGSFGEGGVGSGISICFDTYDNVDGDPNNTTGEAPAINLRVGGQQVATRRVLPLGDLINSAFVPVTIAVNADGSLDVEVNGKAHFSKYYFAGYQPLAGCRFGIGARTGGLNANHFIDDLTIETFLTPVPGIVEAPRDLTVITGSAAAFSVVLNNGDGAAIQWLRDGTAIPGATELTYTLTPTTLADSGAKFSVRVTASGVTVTSPEATLKVVSLDLPATPVLTFNFDDGAVPVGTSVFDSAAVDPAGGVAGSGGVVLTPAENTMTGSFLVEDPNGGAPVYGVAARFALRIGGGTEPPADGFSFNFGTDLPDSAGMGEEGAGTGLSVTIDTYDNTDGNPNDGTGEAPSVGIKYAGAFIADKLVPLSQIRTGDGFADIIIRLTPDGLIDLACSGTVLFDRVPVPGFSSVSGGRFGFYARTGGLNDVHAVDDISLYTYMTAPLRISSQPQPKTVLVGKTASFSVGVSLPEQATYQWFRDGTQIPGATGDTHTTPATTPADDGAKFKVEVKGTDVTLTSDEVALTVVDLTPPVNPQLSYDFNDGTVPAGAKIGGAALIETYGGVDDSGALKLTINENSLAGGFRSPVVENGAQVLDFMFAADVLAGLGTAVPADGFSINVANDAPVTAPGDAENGGGTGVTIAFDTYDNVDGDPNNGTGEAPAIELRYKGAVVASKMVPLSVVNNDFFKQVLVRVTEAGVVDVAFGDDVIFNGLVIPNYAPMNSVCVALYARTGGLNANHFFDNVRLAVRIPVSVTITVEPSDALVLEGQPATFSVQVSNPAGVTYQWRKNGATIAGATGREYITPPQTPADEGTLYSVQVKAPGNTIDSRGAKVMVLDKFTAGPNPAYDIDFNDGTVPAGSSVFGSALIDTSGGINDSGVLKLTINENSLAGSWLLETPPGIETINDVTATWKMLVGGGTAVPADGVSFILGSDIADGAFGEDGAGSGLVVSFDIYDNGGGEAPAIDVRNSGLDAGGRKFLISELETGDQYADIGVRVNRNGTVDLYYGTMAVFRGLPLPEFQPYSAGRFGWGGRTGGLNENQWVDNVRIAVNTQPEGDITLSIKRNPNGTLAAEWSGGGTLQSAPAVTGLWTDVAGAASPYTFTPSEKARFFRVRN